MLNLHFIQIFIVAGQVQAMVLRRVRTDAHGNVGAVLQLERIPIAKVRFFRFHVPLQYARGIHLTHKSLVCECFRLGESLQRAKLQVSVRHGDDLPKVEGNVVGDAPLLVHLTIIAGQGTISHCFIIIYEGFLAAAQNPVIHLK